MTNEEEYLKSINDWCELDDASKDLEIAVILCGGRIFISSMDSNPEKDDESRLRLAAEQFYPSQHQIYGEVECLDGTELNIRFDVSKTLKFNILASFDQLTRVQCN